MAILFGGGRTNKSNAPATSLRVQTALNGQPISIIHGQNRVAGNCIWYDGFASANGGSGKGGVFGGSAKGSGAATYSANFIFGLCEGPIDTVLSAWNGKTLDTLAHWNMTAFDGAPGQAAWGYLTSQYPQAALGYSDLAYVGANPLNLGNSPELPSLTFEIRGAISCAVAEVYSVTSPFTFTPSWWTLASSITEQVTIPASGPFTYQSQGYLAKTAIPVIAGWIAGPSVVTSGSAGVIDINGRIFTKVSSGPTTGQYTVGVGGVYTFAAADAGLSITIIDLALGPGVSYCFQTASTFTTSSPVVTVASTSGLVVGQVARSLTGAYLAPGTVIAAVGPGSTVTLSLNPILNGTSVTLTFVDVPLKQVLGTPSAGQYSVSVAHSTYGQYLFASGDNGKKVFVIDVPDADPSQSLKDFLSNPRYGAGFPSAFIGNMSLLQSYAYAAGLFISPAFVSASAANSYLSDFSTGINGEFVWSAGQLTFVPYGDANLTGFGFTYTAPTQAQYLLTDDDMMKNEGTSSVGVSSYTQDDPVVIAQQRLKDVYNDVKVEYLDRGNSYNPAIVEVKDDAAIADFGLRPADSKELHFFCMQSAAMQSAGLQLGRLQLRNQYAITVPWYFILLDPMDIIEINDAALGQVNKWVLIKEITENQLDGTLSLLCEEYLNGGGSAPVYNAQPKVGYAANYNIDPGAPNTPIIFCPSTLLTGGDLEIWMGISGGVNYVDADVYLSTDGGTSYGYIGSTENGPATMGLLTATYAAGSDPDTTHTLSVNLTESFGTVTGGTNADADAGATLSLVDSELIAYSTATLTSQYNYNMTTYVRRGKYGTPIATHSSGANFLRLDNAIFKYPYPQALLGTTVYIKVVPKNAWGGYGQQSLATATPVSFVIAGPVGPPTIQGFAVEEVNGTALFEWTPLSGYQYGYSIGYGPIGSTLWSQFTPLTYSKPGLSETSYAVPPGNWAFAIVAVDPASGIQSATLTITTASIGYPNKTKSFLIGGDFGTNPWQRGTLFALPILTGADFTADHWAAVRGVLGSAGKSANPFFVSQYTSNLPNGFSAYLQAGRNSGDTHTDPINVLQPIESLLAFGLQGLPVTLSLLGLAGANFSAAGGILTIRLIFGTGLDEGVSVLFNGAWTGQTSVTKTIVLTGTPTQFTNLMFNVPAGTKEMACLLSYQPVGTAGANDWFAVTGLQLEQGTLTTAFEYQSLANIMASCQRFLQRSYSPGVAVGSITTTGIYYQNNVPATGPSATFGTPGLNFAVPMKENAAVKLYSGAHGGLGFDMGGMNVTTDFSTFASASTLNYIENISTGTTWPAGALQFHWVAESEIY